MAVISMNQAEKLSSGGGNYFKLNDGESVTVRLLWDSADNIPIHAVHEYSNNETYSFATIDCARAEGQPADMCKWCVKLGDPVARVFIPFYNEDHGKIEYWKRSYSYVTNTFIPFIKELEQAGMSLAGQPIKVKRTGSTQKDTQYTFIPVGANDGKNVASFGELPNLIECGMLKESDWEDTKSEQPQNQQQGGLFTSHRQTTNVFN